MCGTAGKFRCFHGFCGCVRDLGGSTFFLGDRWRTMKGKNLKLVRGLAVEDARRGGSWCLVQTW